MVRWLNYIAWLWLVEYVDINLASDALLRPPLERFDIPEDASLENETEWWWWKTVVEVPMLMAHDAAMAYFPPHGRRRECRHYKTQSFRTDADFHWEAGAYPSGFSSLLDCGARALDLRLGHCVNRFRCALHKTNGKSLNEGDVLMHHGGAWLQHVTFQSELGSIVRWTKENPGELVLLKVVPDLRGGKPDTELIKKILNALDQYNIPSIMRSDETGRPLGSCWQGKTPWLLRKAKAKHIVAVWKFDVGDTGQPDLELSCVDDNFNPKVGYNPNQPEASFSFLEEYVRETMTKGFSPWGRKSPQTVFEELQFIWQTASTEVHEELSYNLLDINFVSGLNAHVLNVTAQNRATFQRRANLVKVNNLCEFGPDIATALGTRVTKTQRERCSAICGGENKYNPCWR